LFSIAGFPPFSQIRAAFSDVSCDSAFSAFQRGRWMRCPNCEFPSLYAGFSLVPLSGLFASSRICRSRTGYRLLDALLSPARRVGLFLRASRPSFTQPIYEMFSTDVIAPVFSESPPPYSGPSLLPAAPLEIRSLERCVRYGFPSRSDN